MPSLQQIIGSGKVWQARHNSRDSLPERPLSSGFAALDRQLPGGGWQPGQVCEIYAASGSAEISLIVPALAQLSQQPRWILWVGSPSFQRQRLLPQPSALLAAGVDISRILLVHPKDEKQALWSLEEGLKSGHCSAVLGWPATLNKPHIRRLQLAASHHHSLCWLWPQLPFDPSGSPAAVRLGVQRRDAGTLQIECYKRRGLWPGQPFSLPLPASPLQ
ncbi:MAG: translesion DNA synthesis-associated protein ImuA [Pseudomonadota bacterium]|nr:translesion DNA synthesis-associated protein ImuA [Pseudomonadota bacterium]